MKGISVSWCLFCLQFSYEVKAMTSIECLHRACLNNRKGACIAHKISINKNGRCNDYIQAKNSMRHDYDLLQKDHGKWHSKKGCKK